MATKVLQFPTKRAVPQKCFEAQVAASLTLADAYAAVADIFDLGAATLIEITARWTQSTDTAMGVEIEFSNDATNWGIRLKTEEAAGGIGEEDATPHQLIFTTADWETDKHPTIGPIVTASRYMRIQAKRVGSGASTVIFEVAGAIA